MIFSFKADCVLTLRHEEGGSKSSHVSTDFNLSVSENLDASHYLKDGLPNEHGCVALTNAFLHGLIGNLHYAHEKGYIDSAKHLRYLIASLEEGFIAPAKVYTSEFPSEGFKKDEKG